jgi:hypothetical protein
MESPFKNQEGLLQALLNKNFLNRPSWFGGEFFKNQEGLLQALLNKNLPNRPSWFNGEPFQKPRRSFTSSVK